MQILAGVLLFFLSLTIGSLLCWHIYLLCHNMTTIEVSYYSEFQTSHPLHSFVAPYFIVFSSFASVPGGSKSEVACKEERAEISPPVRSWHEEEHSNGTFTLKKICTTSKTNPYKLRISVFGVKDLHISYSVLV